MTTAKALKAKVLLVGDEAPKRVNLVRQSMGTAIESTRTASMGGSLASKSVSTTSAQRVPRYVFQAR